MFGIGTLLYGICVGRSMMTMMMMILLVAFALLFHDKIKFCSKKATKLKIAPVYVYGNDYVPNSGEGQEFRLKGRQPNFGCRTFMGMASRKPKN